MRYCWELCRVHEDNTVTFRYEDHWGHILVIHPDGTEVEYTF